MENYIEGLNPQQLEAVKATEGRIRVVAGAGSGKTKTLTSRFCYLIDKLGISPAHVLCLTFTNKAANEMRKRIAKFIPESDVNDFICTIHGFCVKILRRDIYRLGYPKSFTILDEEDRKSTAKQILKESKLNYVEEDLKEEAEEPVVEEPVETAVEEIVSEEPAVEVPTEEPITEEVDETPKKKASKKK